MSLTNSAGLIRFCPPLQSSRRLVHSDLPMNASGCATAWREPARTIKRHARPRRSFPVNRFFSLLLLLSAAPLLPFSVTSQAQTFTVLHAFNGDGQSPYDTLLSSKGKLYGTTYG